MITGVVLGRHALVPVVFRREGGSDLTIEFVVDTGFTDYLALPSAAVSALALPLLHQVDASLADGSTVQMAVHAGVISWQGVELTVPILSAGQRPLLGTALLDGCELTVRFIEGGSVSVLPLP